MYGLHDKFSVADILLLHELVGLLLRESRGSLSHRELAKQYYQLHGRQLLAHGRADGQMHCKAEFYGQFHPILEFKSGVVSIESDLKETLREVSTQLSPAGIVRRTEQSRIQIGTQTNCIKRVNAKMQTDVADCQDVAVSTNVPEMISVSSQTYETAKTDLNSVEEVGDEVKTEQHSVAATRIYMRSDVAVDTEALVVATPIRTQNDVAVGTEAPEINNAEVQTETETPELTSVQVQTDAPADEPEMWDSTSISCNSSTDVTEESLPERREPDGQTKSSLEEETFAKQMALIDANSSKLDALLDDVSVVKHFCNNSRQCKMTIATLAKVSQDISGDLRAAIEQLNSQTRDSKERFGLLRDIRKDALNIIDTAAGIEELLCSRIERDVVYCKGMWSSGIVSTMSRNVDELVKMVENAFATMEVNSIIRAETDKDTTSRLQKLDNDLNLVRNVLDEAHQNLEANLLKKVNQNMRAEVNEILDCIQEGNTKAEVKKVMTCLHEIQATMLSFQVSVRQNLSSIQADVIKNSRSADLNSTIEKVESTLCQRMDQIERKLDGLQTHEDFGPSIFVCRYCRQVPRKTVVLDVGCGGLIGCEYCVHKHYSKNCPRCGKGENFQVLTSGWAAILAGMD